EVSTAVLLEPRRSLLVSYWAKLLYRLGRLGQALDLLAMAHLLDPQDPTPKLYQAFILRDQNRPSQAIGALNEAVRLNDNRAVYRSRFLLDKDLAVKNVTLSILYDQLGLEPWAFNKATASIKHDYLNSAGHLFLAGALLGLEGRDRAAESEALLARLLQPANLNSFNQFNEYTSFFEGPRLGGTLEGTAGKFDTTDGRLRADGALPQANLAFSLEADQRRTEGWRATNYERSNEVAAKIKWEPHPKHSLMLAGAHNYAKNGDNFYPRYEYDDPADDFDWLQVRTSRLELGYRYHGPYPSDLGPIYFDVFRSVSSQEPYVQAQGQLQFRLGRHQLIFGTLHYLGRHEVNNREEAFMDLGLGVPIPIDTFTTEFDLPKRFHSFYVQDIWPILPSLTLEAALYYDLIEAGNAFFGTEWSLAELGPRLGLIWTPSPHDTIRLAAFRYLLPFYASRVDPLDVAGVTIFRNHMEGSVAQEADLIWEREWKSGFFSANLFHVQREYTYKARSLESTQMVTEDGRMSGLELALNQVLWPGLGLGLGYRFLDVEDEGLPAADRQDHLARAGLTYVHPSGFSASLSQTFRHLQFKAGDRADESMWLTDAQVGYEFPGKRGSVGLEVRNIFDQKFNWVTDFFVVSGRAPGREILLSASFNF
ncbi:MAG: TonB-dependent receptor, partial [Deltaproteobacteria bacterium]|nr:TonB-dependent receptor [Deltaproteobacteria bacterium]